MANFIKRKQIERKEAKEKETETEEKNSDIIIEGKSKKSLKQRIHDFFDNPKKRLIFISSVGLLFIAIFGTGIYLLTHDRNTTNQNNGIVVKDETVPEVKYQAPLDGIMTDQASASRHPLAVIVENHPDARPQAGLDKASIVYEAIAEGGITRFLALFGTYEAEKIGPVRSARTYYVDWAHGYNAFLAHVGGNYDALEKIPADKIYDLDQFRYSSPYWREKLNVATEHTMFTSTAKLRTQAETNKYPTANNFNVYKFKDDATILPESQTIGIDFSTAQYKVDFQYDKTTNSYKRLLAGKAHTDQITKEQLTAKNIIVMTVKQQPTVTKINEPGYNMTTIGTGAAKFFFDGQEINGVWKKEKASDREMFFDTSGNEITFDRGKFWICVVPPESAVTYQ